MYTKAVAGAQVPESLLVNKDIVYLPIYHVSIINLQLNVAKYTNYDHFNNAHLIHFNWISKLTSLSEFATINGNDGSDTHRCLINQLYKNQLFVTNKTIFTHPAWQEQWLSSIAPLLKSMVMFTLCRSSLFFIDR